MAQFTSETGGEKVNILDLEGICIELDWNGGGKGRWQGAQLEVLKDENLKEGSAQSEEQREKLKPWQMETSLAE